MEKSFECIKITDNLPSYEWLVYLFLLILCHILNIRMPYELLQIHKINIKLSVDIKEMKGDAYFYLDLFFSGPEMLAVLVVMLLIG